MTSRVAIVGYGAVGKGLHELFPDAVIYDEPLKLGRREDVNGCSIAFVAVPTPMSADGSCDSAIVESVVDWLPSDVIVLRSTVAPGTTERLVQSTGKHIVFQPEFGPGETPDHPYRSLRNVRWVILGGHRQDTNRVADLYKTVFNADLAIYQTDWRTAELTKYMENCFLALKVAFCNEFFEIAQAMGVDYNELRELWLLDPRVGRSHTFVLPDQRGFGGKCLPKDVTALVRAADSLGISALLMKATLTANSAWRGEQEPPDLLVNTQV